MPGTLTVLRRGVASGTGMSVDEGAEDGVDKAIIKWVKMGRTHFYGFKAGPP